VTRVSSTDRTRSACEIASIRQNVTTQKNDLICHIPISRKQKTGSIYFLLLACLLNNGDRVSRTPTKLQLSTLFRDVIVILVLSPMLTLE
jgi:hypothetical protein